MPFEEEVCLRVDHGYADCQQLLRNHREYFDVNAVELVQA